MSWERNPDAAPRGMKPSARPRISSGGARLASSSLASFRRSNGVFTSSCLEFVETTATLQPEEDGADEAVVPNIYKPEVLNNLGLAFSNMAE